MVYSYNESGKLQKVISGTHTWTITYGISNLTITSTYNSNGAVLSTSNYELDESGKTVSMTAKNGSGAISFTRQVSYDGNGYMTKVKDTRSIFFQVPGAVWGVHVPFDPCRNLPV